jgi:four helix bundle protein
MTEASPYRGGHDIRERAFEFAQNAVRFCQRLYDAGGVARLMAPQLLNCSTSIFAMLEEARGAESRADFISKCSIALKEGREAHGRLRVHVACKVGPPDDATALLNEANALVAIIGTIVSNARANAGYARSAATRRRANPSTP